MNDQEESEIPEEEPEYLPNDLYKRWFKTPTMSGFISIQSALDIARITVDIGEVAGGKLSSHTKVYLPPLSFGPYLKAVSNNVAVVTHEKGYAHYGGSLVDGKPVSRVFKVSPWAKDAPDFRWSAESFVGKRSSTGAFIPLTDQPLTRNSLKVTRAEVAEISYRLDLLMMAWAAGNRDWLTQINSKKS